MESYADLGGLCHAVDTDNRTEIQDEFELDASPMGLHHPAPLPSLKGRSAGAHSSKSLNGLLFNCTSLTTVAMATIASTAGAFAEDLWKPTVGASAVVGENDTLGSLELFFPMMQDEDSVFYLDLRLDPENIDQGKGSYGLGVRQIVDGDLMVGGYVFYNNERVDGNDFKGLSIGAEAITAKWDASINAHIPISGDVSIGTATSGGVSLVGNQLLAQFNSKARRVLMGADVELGRRIRNAFGEGKSLRFSAAGYHYQNTDGADFDITGGRVGFDFEFKDPNDAYSPSLTFGGSVSHDNFYKTQFTGHVRLTIPLGGDDAKASTYGLELDGPENPGSRSLIISDGLLDRVNTPIRSRGLGIMSAETGTTTSSAVINPATGQPFGAFTFADDANSAGAGTFSDPTTLNAAISNAGTNGFVVALENGLAANINSAGETLQDGQTLIGGGSTINIQVDGALTTFTLPGAAGTIEGTGANSAINLANANIIRDVTLAGGGGIAGSGITDGLFNNVAISATGGPGVSIVNGAGTFAFNNVDITNSGGVGVNINGGAANFVFDAASSITHNSAAHDPAIRISAQTGGGVVFNGDVTVTASAGIEIRSSAGDVSFNGNTTITNPNSDAISLNGANGAVTFANVNLTNLGHRGIEIIGATNNVTVNGGTINNANAGYGVTIQSQASTSTITFNNVDITSDPSGADVLNIHNSAGNIDVVGGTFTANSPNDIVDIDNGNATINIGATLIDNGSGNGIEIDGITGGAITFSGDYTRNGNGEAVQIGVNSAVTGGTIDFNGTVAATGGSNIVINNSAAAINFNANVTVTNPTGDAIDFSNSTGSVTFASVDIDGGVQGIDLDDNTGVFTINNGTIDGTTGDAINALNSLLNVSGVSIGSTTAIGGDGIDLSNTDGTSRTSILNGNTIGSATADIAGRGVVVGSTGTGTATVNFVGNNSIRSTNAALEATATNNNTLVMALDNITAERGTAGLTFDIQGASHAALTTPIVVTSLNSFTLVANGANGGALFNNVAFDADGLSGGAVTQVTATGSTNLGQGVGATQRLQGDGFSFLSPVGDINFTSLNIFNNGGTGLEVDTKSVAPTTTFNLDVSAGGINTTGGAALFLDPLTGDLTFDSITGSGSATAGATSSGASGNGNAITIDGFIGTLSSGSTTITGLAAGETGVSFTNNTAGTSVDLGTTSISSTANNVTGLDLQNTNGETIAIGAGSSVNLTGTGTVGVDLSATGANANFTFGDGTAPPSSTIIAETPIDFTGIGTSGTYNFLDVDFTNVNLGAGVGQNAVHYFAQTAQGLGDGSSAANASDTTTADAVTAANTTFIAVGGGTIDLDNNGDGTFNLSANQDLATFASVGSSLNVGLTAIPANVLLNLTAGVVTDGNATGRTSLTTSESFGGDVVVLSENNQLTNVEINNNGNNALAGVFAFGNIGTSVFTNVNISGVLIGLDLSNPSGTLTVDANSSINNTIGLAYREQMSTADITINGTINETDGAGAGVDIWRKIAGTTSFAGMVTANSSNQNAINLTNNLGSTINFTGGLDIDTTNGIGFNASGGGTVSVANAGVETINTAGTGQALVINGMTIGAGGLNFDSVTTAATTTGNAVEITNAAGGAVTVTSVNLAGVVGAAGLRVSGDTHTSNVIIGGGTIASGVSISDDGSGTVQIDANISDNAGYAFQVANRDGAAGAVTVNGTITNAFGAVSLQSNTAGNVTFNGVVTGTGSNNAGAIDVDNVTGGANTFAALVDIDVTGAGTGIDLTNNLIGAFNFTGGLDIDTVTGTGFNATGNGIIHITSPGGATGATVTSTAGTAINISGMSIAAGGVEFGNISSTGGANGISLQNFSGGTFSIANGSTIDIQNSSGAGLIISNPFSDVNFGPGVTTTVNNSTQGIQVLGGVASSDVLLSNIVVDGSTGNGITLAGNSGTVTITGGSVGATTNNGSGALQVSGGNGTLTVGASLTQTSGVPTVNISGRSGGTVTISGDVAGSGANVGVRLQNNSGGTVEFSGQLDLDLTGNGVGVQIANTNAGLTTNFTGGIDINSVNGTGFEALSGIVNVSATAMMEQITTTNGQAVNLNGVTSNITFDSISSTNSAGAGISLDTIAGSFAVSGSTTITDATGDGISLTGNAGTATFGATNIDLGATAATAGIDIEGVNGLITLGATTITDVKTDQTGIDFTGADAPANFGITAISGPVDSAGTGIDLSSTQNSREINFATGSSITFTGTGASTGVQLAASDLVATTANANFTFGDGSLPTGSTISVGASGVTVDTIGLSAASGTYNFVDVAFTGNADLVTADTATFVSQAGGVLSAGTFGLSDQITTIDVATAEAQADTNQTFAFVGNNLDFSAMGADGFRLDDGQSVDGFANGNSVSIGSIVPANISGIAGGFVNVTANDTQITNSTGTSVIFTLVGNNTVENVVVDNGGGNPRAMFDATGAAGSVTIQNTTIQNASSGSVFSFGNFNGTANILNNNINVSNQLLTTGGTGNITLTRGTGANFTAGGSFFVGKTGGSVVVNGDLTLNTTGPTGFVMVGSTNTDVTFNGLLDINATTASGISLVSNNTSTISFLGGLDITTVTGTGFNAQTGGTISVANAGTEQIVATGAGRAISLNGVTVGAGGINFDQITTNAASTSTSINIDTTTGGPITIASANLNGSSYGLLVSDANTAVNVNAGTINNGVSIVRGGNTVTIGANITKATGAALNIIRRNTASAIIINGNITSSATAVNVFQAGGALLNVNGTVAGTGTDATGSIDLSENGGGSVITFANQVTLNMTGNGTGVHQDAVNGGADVRFTGGLDITTVDGTGFEILDGVLTVANAGIEAITSTGTGQAINFDSVSIAAGGVNFDSVDTNGATVGIGLNDVSGSGGINFDTTNLQNITSRGIDLSGTNSAAITFTDLDISLNNSGAVAFDLNGAVINANITASDFDVTNNAASGTSIGIDLTGTTGSGTIQLGEADTNGGANATITGVNSGVVFDAATNTTFTFGDGDGTAGDLISSSISAMTPITGILPTNGTYDFEDVTFTGDVSNLSGGASFFVFDEEGTSGAGTFADPGTAAQAAAASVDVLVAVDNSGFVGNTIVLSDAGQGAINTLVLDDNQALIGLIGGQSIDASTLGLGLSAGAPASFLLTGLGGSTVITGSGVAAGVTPSVATTGANNAIELTGTGAIQSIYIDNLGTGDAINASFASAETVTIRSATIIASGGDAIDISTTAGASMVNLEANEINGSLRLNGAGGGTLAANTVGAANTINAYAATAVDINTVTTNLSFASITGNGAGTTSFGINLNSLGANSIFTVTGATTLDNYTNADLNIGSISADDVTINLDAVNIRTAAGGLAQGGFSEFQVANVSGANLDINVGDLTIGNAGHASDTGIRLISISGANTTIDLASYTSTRAGQSTEIVGFNSVGGGLTVAGTTNITDAGTHGIRMYGSSSNATFLGNTTITNSTGFNGSGVVLGVGGANTGTYSFAGLDVSVTGTGAFGLQATNSGTLNITGGTNNITSNNGTAVLINPTITNITLQNITSSNSTDHGISLDLAGAGSTFTVTGTTNVTSSANAGIDISNSEGTVSFGATNILNTATAGGGVALSANPTAITNFNSTLDIDTTAGVGLDHNSGGAVTVTGALTIDTTTGAGLNVISTNTGSFTANNAGNTIATVSNEPINISSATVNATFATVSASALNGSRGIDINNHAGTLTINGGTITNTGSGDSIEISGGAGTISVGTNVVSTGASGHAVEVTSRTGGAIILSGNYTDAGGTHGGSLNFSNNSGGSTTFLGDVRIDSGARSAVTMINSPNHTVTFDGTNTEIDSSNSYHALEIAGSGGALAFNSTGTNTVTATGGGSAINVTNGTNITVTGSADLSVAAAGASTTAVNILGTIGAGGVTLSSVTQNGGDNAIVLNGTGAAGAFTVTGTGTTDGSGGTIQNISGNAIQITNANNIDLRNVNLTNVASSEDTGTTVFGGNIADYYAGIKLTNVNSVSLNNVDINGGETAAVNGNLGQVGISGQTVSDLTITDSIVENFGNSSGEDNIQFQGLTGTVTISNLLSRDSGGDLFAIDNTGSGGTAAGGNLTMTVTGSTFDETVNGVGAGGLRLSVNGAGTTSVSVNTSTFGNGNLALTNGGLQGTGLQLNVGRGHVGTLTAEDNLFQGMNVGISATLDSAGVGADPQLTANIRDGADGGFVGNTITRIRSNAINLFTNGSLNPGEGQLTATISGNVIGTLGTLGSGSFLGSGIQIGNEGGSSVTALIDGNTIQEVANFEGIIVSNNVSAGANNVTITNNTFAEINFDRPIQVEQTIVGGTTCSNISGNSFSGTIDGGPFSSASDIIRVRQTAGIHNSTQTSAANIQTVNGGVGIVTDTGTINFSQPPCILP